MASEERDALPSFELPAGIPCPAEPDGTASAFTLIPGYVLVRLDEPWETECPYYGPDRVFLSEYDVCRKLSERYARCAGRELTEPLELFVDKNEYGRCQLCLNLTGTDGKSHKVSYAHLVACALLKARRDVRGHLCDPHYIAPKDWYVYEADHDLDGDQCDCSLGAMTLECTGVHRGIRRQNWPQTSLPRDQRGLKRPASSLRRSEPQPKAKPQARSRNWQ